MKVNLVIKHLGSSGGTKILIQYAGLLHNHGHEVKIITGNIEGKLKLDLEPTIVNPFNPLLFPHADITIATKPRDVLAVSKIKDSKICHLCQGLEMVDLDARINGQVVPQRYQKEGFYNHLKYQIKKLKYRKKRRKIDSIYCLNTYKIAVSEHLKRIIEEKYGRICYFVPNGIDLSVFYPKRNGPDYFHGPIKIISIGSFEVTIKNIGDILAAIKLLKKERNIIFTRVATTPRAEEEKESGLVDNYYYNISEAEIADLYREHNILIAASLEGEGFGLPAIEAMACGTPCILTEISSYLNFDHPRDYCYFVQTHSPQAIADAVEEIINDRERRLKIIARGYEVARKYSLENTGEILENTLLKILG